MPIAFQCRVRPQGCDALDIFKKARHVFIGYPLVRGGVAYDSQALRKCLVDPRCSDEEWQTEIAGRENRNFTKNRNFVPRVNKGSIVVIPRPKEGAVYVGRVKCNFDIIDNPPWAQEYLDVRKKQALDSDDDTNQHVADVAQGWAVEEYRRIELVSIPGWMRRSLFGRSTYNELPSHPLDRDLTAHVVLDRILAGLYTLDMSWSLSPEVVKRRLVDMVNNPCAFENLVVALLQLDNPCESWQHTGGSGDGGIDGLGSNEAGEVVSVMQAKYYADTAPQLGYVDADRPLRRYAAVFLPENPREPADETCLLNLDWIVQAVCRHWKRLPYALTLRIGEGTN